MSRRLRKPTKNIILWTIIMLGLEVISTKKSNVAVMTRLSFLNEKDIWFILMVISIKHY